MGPVPRRLRPVLASGGLVVAVAGSGALSWASLRTATATAAPTVRTATVQRGSIRATTAASGNVQPASALNVGFATPGKVATVAVAVGQHVDAGTVLATLDAADAQKAVDRAKEALTQAQADLVTAKAATADAKTALAAAKLAYTSANGAAGTTAQQLSGLANAVTQADSTYAQRQSQQEQAASNVESAQDKLDSAQAALDATTLKAPSAGTVTAVGVVPGQSATASGISAATTSSSSGTGSSGGGSTAPFTISDLSSLLVKTSVAEADAGKVKVGQAASIAFDALTDVQLAGRVASIAPTSTVSNNVVSYDVLVSLVGPPPTVRTGMTANVTITTAVRDGVLRVATAAVRGSGANATVTVVAADGTQSTRRITAGMRGDDATEVVTGLAEGDKVVVATAAASTGRTAATTPGRGGLGGVGTAGAGARAGGVVVGGGGFGPPPGG